MNQQYKTIDDYIQSFPESIQNILEKIRQTIHKAAPEAVETISYSMPAFRQNGPLVYYAAFKNHIGFYPTPSAIGEFRAELSRYKSSKGAVQFPLAEPVPFDLIEKIVRFRVKENLAKNASKKLVSKTRYFH
jgi:uncharacterized protein YdhG (YjbR/CyaY superfamily)